MIPLRPRYEPNKNHLHKHAHHNGNHVTIVMVLAVTTIAMSSSPPSSSRAHASSPTPTSSSSPSVVIIVIAARYLAAFTSAASEGPQGQGLLSGRPSSTLFEGRRRFNAFKAVAGAPCPSTLRSTEMRHLAGWCKLLHNVRPNDPRQCNGLLTHGARGRQPINAT